jgi:translation initiation factor 3 subunit G
MALDKFVSAPGRNPTTQPSKVRWGELDEDDGEDLDFLLPPRQIIGPDENGVKKVIEYKFDEDGNKVKITTTTRVRKLAKAQLSKRAVERRSWPKFGDAVREDVGSRLTMVSTEEILLERPRAPGSLSPSLPLSLSLRVCSCVDICGLDLLNLIFCLVAEECE